MKNPVNLAFPLAALAIALLLPWYATLAAESDDPRPWTYTREVVTSKGASRLLTGVNVPRTQGQLAVFTPDFGTTTMTLPPSTEAVVVGGVVKELRRSGNAKIPAGGYVLSCDDGWIAGNLMVGQGVQVRLRDGLEKGWQLARALDGTNTGRGEDMLVAYTPEGKRKSTGTNEYGLEAVVRGNGHSGVVEAVGGNNSPIPTDGFVVSGHGAAATWLRDSLVLGAKVTIEGSNLTVTVDTDSYLAIARRVVKRLEVPVGTPIPPELLARRRRCDTLMKQAELSLSSGKVRAATDQALQARDLANCSLQLTRPSPSVEMRGVWYRASEATPGQIRETLDVLKGSGVNALFLELFYGGRTIYPSTLAEQRPEFAGWDPLSVWAKEAHTRGIALHGWVHTFNVSEDGTPGPILEQHPDWAAIQRDGSMEPGLEPGLFYIDASVPQARDFISSLIDEMTRVYALDGIELDYVRYPPSESLDYSFSYSAYARAAFKTEQGVDPLELTPDSKLWRKWVEWRQTQVTSFVRRIRGELKAKYPNVLLSAAVFGDTVEARNSKMQDWMAWVDEGLMDFTSPMLYSFDRNWVGALTGRIDRRMGSRALLIPGIAPFMGFSTEELLDQIETLRAQGAEGVSLFALHTLKGGQLGVLQNGPFRIPAQQPVLPHETGR